MTFLDRLERHLGPYAIPGLIRYIVVLNAAVFLTSFLNRELIGLLNLTPTMIQKGELWRLITWIFVPTTTSPLFIFFYLSFTWWVGDCLESTWGSFRLNLYYFLGMAGCTAAAVFFGGSGGNYMLSFSLLLAAATLAPNLEILFLIFPMKLKWSAIMGLIPVGLAFASGEGGARPIIVLCLANYLLFFAPALLRGMRERRSVMVRRGQFEAAKDNSPYLHKCEVCGITEITNPEADFRVADNDKEYCTAHLPK